MTAVPFDTLKLADRLQSGGFSAEQARTVAGALAEAVTGSEIATKQDLANLATKDELRAVKADVQAVKADIQAVKTDIQALRAEVKADIQGVRSELQAGLAETKAEILKWMVGTIGVQTAAILGAAIAIVRLLH